MGFNVFGLGGSGIDWDLYIGSIMKAEQEKLARTIGRQEVKASATSTVFANVQGAMRSLNAAINDFKFSGDFKQKNVTSSKPEIITATATLGAIVQGIQVEVHKKATNEKHSLSFSSVEDTVTSADTSISITVRGEIHEIDVPAGTTLEELRGLINAENIGVTVAVFDAKDGSETPVRLTIQDKKLGLFDKNKDDGLSDNIIFDISGLNGVSTSFEKTVAAQDTHVRIEGQDIYRDSHVISDVIPGVSFQVLKEDPETPVTLTVTESITGASDKVQTLVDRYNEVVALLKKALQFDPNLKTQTNPTAGNSSLRNILTRVQSTFTSSIMGLGGDRKITSLADLGVKTSFQAGAGAGNGFLEFDKSKFNAALSDNYDEVIEFFEGITEGSTDIDGFADTAGSLMDSFLNSTDGVITTKIKGLQEELKALDQDKTAKLELLVAKEERLVLQFSRLETQMARLNGQQSQLNSAIQSLNLNNQFISNRGGK